MGRPVPKATAETLAFHRGIFVLDALSLFYILDERWAENALAGGVNATNVTFSTEHSWDETIEAVETGLDKIEKSPLLKLCTSAAELEQAAAAGKLGVIMGTQGSAFIERRLQRLEIMVRLGLRIFGLAYTGGTLYADGCGETRDAGLSFLGRELVALANELPLLLDLSHCGHRTRAEATEAARAPVCTHSNAYAVEANDRNTRDETARAIVAKGGMVGICALPSTVRRKDPTLADLIDHAEHYVRLLGAEHVGFGTDFIEAYAAAKTILPESRRWRTWRPDIFGTVEDFLTQTYPIGITGIRELPNLTQGLLDRGYSREQVAGIMGGNWLRVFRDKVG